MRNSTHPKPDATSAGGGAADLAGVLLAASRGDEAAWRELIARYARRVYALAKSRCKKAEVAEEVAQSVFVTIAGKLADGGYVEQGRFESWLFRVTMNRIRDEMRRGRRQAMPTDPATLTTRAGQSEASFGGSMDDEGELKGLRLAMEQLHSVDREVVELRHHGGLSFKQMAELLDEPVGTLLARHHRALRKLKQILTGGVLGVDR